MAQIFVYGDSLQACLVGIVVPDEGAVKAWATEHNVPGTTLADWVKLPELKAFIEKEMQKTAKEGKVGLLCL